eukprot:Hpha_TRINITY_DN22243_c0_g1::TRINITY_DN22243_c0_g1_i1::g.167133::m.167133
MRWFPAMWGAWMVEGAVRYKVKVDQIEMSGCSDGVPFIAPTPGQYQVWFTLGDDMSGGSAVCDSGCKHMGWGNDPYIKSVWYCSSWLRTGATKVWIDFKSEEDDNSNTCVWGWQDQCQNSRRCEWSLPSTDTSFYCEDSSSGKTKLR